MTSSGARRFPFARPLGWAVPGWEQWAVVVLDDTTLHVRFGPWHLAVPRDEIVDAEVSGPYSPLKALGVRLSLADGGLTFGTSAAGGACLRFAHPRRGVEPFGLLRHPAVTVTVADPAALVDAVRTPRAGAVR